MTCSTSWRPRPGCSGWWCWPGRGGRGRPSWRRGSPGGGAIPAGSMTRGWCCWHSFEPGVRQLRPGRGDHRDRPGRVRRGLRPPGPAAAAGRGETAARAVPGAAGVGQLRVGPGDARPGRGDPAAGRGGLRAAAGVPGVGAGSLRQRGDHHQPGAGGLAGPGPPDRGGRAEPGRGRRSTPSYLLAPYPAARRRRERRSFGELLDWLDGHPLAMRLTLPRLDTTDPADLLAGLRGTTPLPAGRTPGRAGCPRWGRASPTPSPTWPSRPGGCSRRSACSTASPTRTS